MKQAQDETHDDSGISIKQAQHPAKKMLLKKHLRKLAGTSSTHKKEQREAAERETIAKMSYVLSGSPPVYYPGIFSLGAPTTGVAQWILDRGYPHRDMSLSFVIYEGSQLGQLKLFGMPSTIEDIITWFNGLSLFQLAELETKTEIGTCAEFAYYASIYLELVDGLHPDWPCTNYQSAKRYTQGEPLYFRYYGYEILNRIKSQ